MEEYSPIPSRMDTRQDPQAGINSWLEDELRQQYRQDRGSVDPDWKGVFEGRNGHAPVAAHAETALAPGEELLILRGAPARIAENMGASVSVPLATSQRIIPVKVIEEN